jgi:hypothetical protein
VTPLKPTFNANTRVVTIPTPATGTQYKAATYVAETSTYTATGSVLTPGAQSAAASGVVQHIIAEPTGATYVLSSTAEDAWSFAPST